MKRGNQEISLVSRLSSRYSPNNRSVLSPRITEVEYHKCLQITPGTISADGFSKFCSIKPGRTLLEECTGCSHFAPKKSSYDSDVIEAFKNLKRLRG